MTTTRPGGIDIAAIPADELESKVEYLVGSLNPIDHMDCAALLMATCDMRTREALALRWEDVDFDAGTIDVRRACDESGSPSPVKVRRTIDLPAVTAEGLRRRRTVQTAYFKRYAKNLVGSENGQAVVRSDAPIVATPEGKPVRPKAFSRWWHDKRCDFEMPGWTLSDLRRARMAIEMAGGR